MLQDRLRPARRSFHKVAWSPRQRRSSSFRREQDQKCGELLINVVGMMTRGDSEDTVDCYVGFVKCLNVHVF